ncbi:trypsin-like serine peptidase [Kitasatospora sp. NPDC057223]|uniref:trypsin-like serine peptidase n=1 Tax=Kitasatospora sp. NPDC057223 TaxID=3346055 RepID=UPI00362E720C
MGHHRRREARRRRILRPALLTACTALAVAAVLTGTHVLTSGAAAPGTGTGSADAVLTATASPGSDTPAPADSPAPAATADPTATATTPTTTPTPAATKAAAAAQLGATSDAPADAASAKVGALFDGAVKSGKHFCTASVVHSPTRNLLLTAAHCLSSSGDITFAPGYRDGTAPYGSWKVTRVHTTTGWDRSKDQDEDFAVLEVATAADGREIEDVVGANPLGTGEAFTSQVRLTGYPNSGETPITCVNATTRQDTYQRAIDCPAYTGGTSGGPWISTATGAVIGLIGGYQEGGDTPDTSYSAYFDHTVASLYATAVAQAS